MTTAAPATKPKDTRTEGAWLAYYDDWSAMAVFSSEVQALRYAVSKNMRCARVPFGVDLHDAIRNTPAPERTGTT